MKEKSCWGIVQQTKRDLRKTGVEGYMVVALDGEISSSAIHGSGIHMLMMLESVIESVAEDYPNPKKYAIAILEMLRILVEGETEEKGASETATAALQKMLAEMDAGDKNARQDK